MKYLYTVYNILLHTVHEYKKPHNVLNKNLFFNTNLSLQTSWLGRENEIPVFGEGNNTIPTIHIVDLARFDKHKHTHTRTLVPTFDQVELFVLLMKISNSI